jgi:hypothetical protein
MEYRKHSKSASSSNQVECHDKTTLELEALGNDIRNTLNMLKTEERMSHQAAILPSDSRRAHAQPHGAASPTKRVNSVPYHERNPFKTSYSSSEQTMLLERLMKLPKSHLEKLPKAQRELVAFSQKYQEALTLPPDKVALLPLPQQHMIAQMKSRMTLS